MDPDMELAAVDQLSEPEPESTENWKCPFCVLSEERPGAAAAAHGNQKRRVRGLTLKTRLWPLQDWLVRHIGDKWPKFGMAWPEHGKPYALGRYEPFWGSNAPDVGPLNMRVAPCLLIMWVVRRSCANRCQNQRRSCQRKRRSLIC